LSGVRKFKFLTYHTRIHATLKSIKKAHAQGDQDKACKHNNVHGVESEPEWEEGEELRQNGPPIAREKNIEVSNTEIYVMCNLLEVYVDQLSWIAVFCAQKDFFLFENAAKTPFRQ